MKSLKKNLLAAGLAGAVIAATTTTIHAASPEDSAVEPPYGDLFGQKVEAYIMDHPEVIMSALNKFQADQERQRSKALSRAVSERMDEILGDGSDPVSNPKGSVTIVEWYDYNCSYCKAAAPMVEKFLEDHPDVRLVYKEFPILHETSDLAARASLAAWRQDPDLFETFHRDLFTMSGKLNKASIFALAESIGYDSEQMKEDMADPAVAERIETNKRLASQIGIGGTPTFIIGDTVFPGLVPAEQLEAAVEEIRQQAKN